MEISRKQHGRMAAHAREQAIDRLCHHLVNRFPDRLGADPQALRPSVADDYDRARALGLTSAADITTFVELKHLLAGDFDQDPEFVEAVQDPAAPAGALMPHAVLVLPPEVWRRGED